MNTSELYDLAERLSALMRVDARQASAPHKLQPVQLEALRYLAHCNKFSDTPMGVTEYLGQTKGTVSQTLKALEAKGLLTKQPDPGDKRIAHLHITPQGRQLVEQSLPPEAFVSAAETLSRSERQETGEHLRGLLAALLRANNMRTYGLCATCKHNRHTPEGYFCALVQQPLAENEVKLLCREHEWPNTNQT